MSRMRAPTTDAVEILRRRYLLGLSRRTDVAIERLNVDLALMIRDVRTKAALTQEAFAVLVGMSQSAVSRLENVDYCGRSLTTLQRIAEALDLKLTVEIIPRALVVPESRGVDGEQSAKE